MLGLSDALAQVFNRHSKSTSFVIENFIVLFDLLAHPNHNKAGSSIVAFAATLTRVALIRLFSLSYPDLHG